MSKRLRAVVALGLVLGVAVAAGLLLASSATRPLAHQSGEEQGGLAFQRHVMDSPGDPNREGPASYPDQVAELNAYPGDAVTAEQIAGAQSAGASLASRGVGKGKNSTTSWYALGPTDAVYPAFLNRHGSRYVTSGRITALAISPTCTNQQCTIWLAAAGGGVWRTDKGLNGNAGWVNVSDGSFASGAIGALTYDAAHSTLYAGTGEDAAAGDAEAGVGIYKSTDGGSTWTPLAGNANFLNRSIQRIVVDPHDATGQTLYIADGRGVHGISSTTAGAVSQVPGAPGVGVWKSTNGGGSFTLLAPQTVVLGALPGQTFPSSFGSTRGATQVAVDPTHAGVIYAGAYNVGVWRSLDNGATWTNIHPCAVDPLAADGTCGAAADRSEFALATTPDGHTRMYQTEGDSGPPTDANNHVHGDLFYSRFFIANAVESGSPTFTDKTSAGLTFHTDSGGNIVADPSSPGYATYNFCTGQCWYDQGVFSPAGHPNMLYIFGSYVYGEAGNVSNARGLLLSTDGGTTFTDLTEDSSHVPDGLHPDQHALAVNPNDPFQFWEGSDGGIMRSDGGLADTSARCDSRGLSNTHGELDRCRQLLSAVPAQLVSLNSGLGTLQFQSLSVNPADSKNIQGGTQDNGTFETQGSSVVWPQTIFGDGGVSGFDSADRHVRVHTYFGAQIEVSFQNGDPPSWDWISDPFNETSLFYLPVLTDPVVSGTIYTGLQHVWRTLDDGGPRDYLDSNCNRFTGAFAPGTVCGDWVKLGDPTANGRLTCNSAAASTPTCPYGNLRSGGSLSWLARSSSNANVLWAATSTGRVFISTNGNSADQASVTFKRLDATPTTPATPDTLTPNAPGRAVSSIQVDPANPNHVWISYLSYSAITPTTPGHVFSVTYNPGTGTATWTSLDGSGAGALGDLPINGVAVDTNGDVYAAHDFGVAKLTHGTTTWTNAAAGLPVVTVAGLTLNAGARQLLAATHGRGAYQLTLP